MCASTAVLLVFAVLGSTDPRQQAQQHRPRPDPITKQFSSNDILGISCGETVEGFLPFDSLSDQLLLLSFSLDEPMLVSLDGCKSMFDTQFYIGKELPLSKESSQAISSACKVAHQYVEFHEDSYIVGVEALSGIHGGNFVVSMLCERPGKEINTKVRPETLDASMAGTTHAPIPQVPLALTVSSTILCGQTVTGSTANGANHYTGQRANDVVFSFSASNPMTVQFNGCASSYDTYVYLTNSGLTQIASNDDSSCGTKSILQTTLASSGTYYFIVDGFGFSTGSFSFTLTCSSSTPAKSSTVPTPSRTASRSPTMSPSRSPTHSKSVTRSKLVSPSTSKSSSVSVSFSLSASTSTTPSRSAAPSSTSSISLSLSAVPSPTQTMQPSQSRSPVPSTSVSHTPPPSISVSPSRSRSLVPVPSPSPSASSNLGPFSASVVTPITCGQTITGSTSGASNHYTGQPAGDVVTSFVITQATTVSFNGCTSNYDTYFYLLDSTGSIVTSDDDSSCGVMSIITITLRTPGLYYFIIDGYASSTGPYTVAFTCQSPTPTPVPTPTPTPTPINELTYHQGPIMLGQVNVYLIWYGSWSSTAANIFQSYTRFFAQNVDSTPWYNIITPYTDSHGNHVSPDVVLAGEVVDNYSVGTTIDDTNVFTIVQNALQKLPTDSNGVYFVIPSSDLSVPGLCNSWCGYHTWGSGGIKYALVPDATNCGYRCGVATSGPSLSGNYGADAFMSVFAHELVETVTDPLGSAYYDGYGQENADKCAWTFGTQYFTPSGAVANMNLTDSSGHSMAYKIQQNWILAQGSTSGHCALSL